MQSLIVKSAAIVLAVFIIVCLAGGCTYANRYFGYKDDHLAEEIFEEVIESQIGIEVDLSPDSEE